MILIISFLNALGERFKKPENLVANPSKKKLQR
jgi:hypothetical protein